MAETTAYTVPPTEREQLSNALDDPGSGSVTVQTSTGMVELPAAAAAAVRHLLSELASGAAVHVLADNAELTTQQAADLLGISRTYLVRLVDQGTIPAHFAGTHRRLCAADVLAYQNRRAKRLDAVAEVTHADRTVGLPYR